MFPVIYTDEFLRHETGSFHPEKPGRLSAIQQALHLVPWADQLEWRLPTPVGERSPLAWIGRIHEPRYIKAVQTVCQQGGGMLDADTAISSRSYDVALLAVNAWLDGVDYALTKRAPVFVLARPPGHHALPYTGMGFCIFSNAAIAAHYALEQGAQRVAILDWDVHHGNGTQAIVANHPQISYCSLHEFPHYPGTGRPTETGAYHNVLNLPVSAGSTIADYRRLFETKVMPFLQHQQPDVLLVSAGYDANADDPLADVDLRPADYGELTRYCLSLTHAIVFGLEGGYDFSALAQSVVATIEPCVAGQN
jgi:acetoin utilization deacetylase AcuC-like enzyme